MSASVRIERLEDRIPASETLGLGVSAAISGILSQDRAAAAPVAAETSPALLEGAPNGAAKAPSPSKPRKPFGAALLDAHFAELAATGTSASVGSQSQFPLTGVRDRGPSPVGGAFSSDFASLLGNPLTTGIGAESNGSSPEPKTPGRNVNIVPSLPAPIAPPAGGAGGATRTGSGGSAGFTFSTADNGPGNASHSVNTGASAGSFFGSISAVQSLAADGSLPEVTLSVSDASAAEAGPDSAFFVVSRTGETSGALTVWYTLSGTATMGDDYGILGNFVTLGVGESSATIQVTPILDTLVEGDETVTPMLVADANAYVLGTSTTATATIKDAPVVTIAISDASVSEIGPNTGTLTISRTGDTTNALGVNFLVAGSATEGTDYNAIGGSVTIPAGNASTIITITPVTDTDVEGIEDILVSLSASNDYAIGAINSATVDIRDRAGVKSLVATAGNITGIPTGGNRDITGGTLEITQGDGITFEAVPTDGGDFAPNEPTWTVTGISPSPGTAISLSFSDFRATTIVSVATPAGTAKTVAITMVPFPTRVLSTSILTPISTLLPGSYGTVYEHIVSASNGATGADLIAANRTAGANGQRLLELEEYVEFNAPYNILWDPIEKPAGLFSASGGGGGAAIIDTIGQPVGTFPTNAPFGTPNTVTPVVSPQDFRWKSNAADTLNIGWHDFQTDIPIEVALSAAGAGWVVTTTDNGKAFKQPFYADGSYAQIAGNGGTIPYVSPNPFYPGVYGAMTLTLTGTVSLTAADVAAGFKVFNIEVWDNDYYITSDDLLETLTVAVPAANGVDGQRTSFSTTVTLYNNGHNVVGNGGPSGEQTANVYFIVEGGATSNTVSITAE